MRHYMLSVLCIFANVPLCGLATPLTSRWEEVHVKHSWSSVPDDWTNLGHPAADTTIDLHIALKAENESALIDALNEVSSPDHPKYGKHLSKVQVAELVAPPTEVLELINTWLEHHGILPSSKVITKHGGSQLTLIGVPVSRANDILGASYQLYHHIGTNTTVLRTLSYGLPEALLESVQTVVPTTNFGFPIRLGKNPSCDAGKRRRRSRRPQRERTGQRYICLRAHCGKPECDRRWRIHGDCPSPDDLVKFMRTYRAGGTYAPYAVALVNGGTYNPNNPGQEANLDIQYSLGIASPIGLIFYSTGETHGDWLVSWLEYMLDQISIPQTITLSYGFFEVGISPEYATGDHGVGPGQCLFNDGNGNLYVRFIPTFPSTCPGSPASAEQRITSRR
ncbi:Pro-kumamolisin, activation domain-containing protein [Lactarius quietus]|nr:Pro-kumamolisin, activation domain-containing protein [Lactarius quietus]